MKKTLFVLTIYAILFGGNFMLYSLVLPIRISFHLLASLALVVYLYKKGLPDSPLTIGTAVMLLAVWLSVPGALDSRMAFENAWSYLVNLLALLSLIQLSRSGYAPTLFKAHFVAGAFCAIFALIQFATTHARPTGWFDNITLTGAYLAALILPVFHTARSAERFERLAYSALTVLLALAVLTTETRGALLSVGVGAVVYLFFFWKEQLLLKLSLGGIVVCGGVLILIFLSAQPQHANGDPARADLWRSAGQMIDAYPLGVGAGLFAQGYAQIGASGEYRFTGAHNHYLTLGAELGAVGLAAGAIFFLLILYGLIDLPLSSAQKAVLAALCGVAAQLLFDNYPANNWALLIGLYTAFVIQEARLIPAGRHMQVISAVSALVLVVFTVYMFRFDQAQVLYESAVKTGRYYDAYEAAALDPDNRLYRLELEHLQKQDTPLSPVYALVMYGRYYK